MKASSLYFSNGQFKFYICTNLNIYKIKTTEQDYNLSVLLQYYVSILLKKSIEGNIFSIFI